VVSLRDLLHPEHVYQPLVEGTPDEFPTLPTGETGRHNLPTQTTSLIGRETELATVLRLVGSHRLVTLTGVGGCGKTRLGLAAAAECVGEFPDGVFFVELASVADPQRVSEVVAATLGLSLAAGSDQRSVGRFLSDKKVLLVLDNCEHLLDAVADFVHELLSAGSHARVLATSRESLDVPGEQSHRVASLDEGSSLALLVARAKEASDAFVLVTEDTAAAAELCKRLGGIPLALELAAGHLDHLSARELLKRLDDRFQLLVGGTRRHRQRQQTLQAVMEWSWNLLSIDERRVLATLSVFAGGWTLDAAEDVAGRFVAGSQPVTITLGLLTKKSLVESRPAHNGRRYRMLETVRLFAQQQLVDLGLAADARVAHRDRFLRSSEATPLDQQLWWMPQISATIAELENLALAFEWSVDHEDLHEAAALLLATVGPMHEMVGKDQGYRWARLLLERDLDDVDRVGVLTAGVVAAVGVGDHIAMEQWGAEAEELMPVAPPVLACFLLQWRAAASTIRQPERAASLYGQASVVAAETGSPLATGYIAAWSLSAHLCTQPGRTARPDWTPSRFGGVESMGWSCALTTAILHEARNGRLADAESLLEAARRETAHPLDDVGMRALVQALADEPARAIEAARLVLQHAQQISDVAYHAEMALAVAIARYRAGDPFRALTYLDALRRAALYLPMFYDLRRDFAEQARAQLDEAAIAQARTAAKSLDVESILDRELRVPAND
jgi:predicted ATPase